MSKIKNDGLDQYGAGPFKHQQFGTAGVERVNKHLLQHCTHAVSLVQTKLTFHAFKNHDILVGRNSLNVENEIWLNVLHTSAQKL